nr:hypothetical protein [Sicyoidochytrium minutum DNA virus]
MELSQIWRDVVTRECVRRVRLGWRSHEQPRHAPGYTPAYLYVTFKNPEQTAGESYNTVSYVLHETDYAAVRQAEADHIAVNGR